MILLSGMNCGMKMTELVIVGNGFDRHHGLETSYGSFALFAQENAPSAYRGLSSLFLASSEYMGFSVPGSDDAEKFIYDRWCRFEAFLGLLDEDEFGLRSQEDISEYMQELGMEETLVDDFVCNIASILDVFRDWVSSIDLPLSRRRNFAFQPSACFVNFNYTETLEVFYGIERDHIFYIHGRRGTADKLIVGHDTRPPTPRFKDDLPDIQFNPFYRYLRLTHKPVEDIEPKLQQWLEKIATIERISVRGHSLGPFDLPYFAAIARLYPEARWSFSYFSNEDLDSIQTLIQFLNLETSAVLSVATLAEFEADPATQRNRLIEQSSFYDLMDLKGAE